MYYKHTFTYLLTYLYMWLCCGGGRRDRGIVKSTIQFCSHWRAQICSAVLRFEPGVLGASSSLGHSHWDLKYVGEIYIDELHFIDKGLGKDL